MKEAQANIRLINTAPELLDALKEATHHIDTIVDNYGYEEGLCNSILNAASDCERYKDIIAKALEGNV